LHLVEIKFHHVCSSFRRKSKKPAGVNAVSGLNLIIAWFIRFESFWPDTPAPDDDGDGDGATAKYN